MSRLEPTEAMFNAGAPEFCIDQSMYYPNATSYGYIGAGIEPTGDSYGFYGLNGQDTQYYGIATENVQYVYYPPGYGYAQSYNPYNPLIPGAMLGTDGSFIAPQQYYALQSYEMPMVLQSTPDTVDSGASDKVLSVGQFTGAEENQRKSVAKVAEENRTNNGSFEHTGFTSGNIQSQSAKQVHRAIGGQGIHNSSLEKALLDPGLLGNGFSSANGMRGLSSSNHTTQSSVHDISLENQLVVKARTSLAGNPDAQGNITIFLDQYNCVGFPIDYKHAKFCVIKSFSEDDVHKSIKYNVWSSTPNGNKKLNAAYEGSQRIVAGGCPIFLFFSVNASGQFCGVAEMTGPVDFDKSMDFWQQDKWRGCFPVKWHFVKDLPNSSFRQISLENNENRPVTYSRDTQEIPYKKGLEMLRIFKNYTSKTSLLDDFMYYENRQQVMLEERVRLLIKSNENPYFVTLLDPPRKLQSLHDINVSKRDKDCSRIQNANEEANATVMNPSVNTDITDSAVVNGSNQILADPLPNIVDELRVSSLSINTQVDKTESSLKSESVGVVTIGSMPVNVNGTKSSTFLSFGNIPLDPIAHQ